MDVTVLVRFFKIRACESPSFWMRVIISTHTTEKKKKRVNQLLNINNL